MTDRVFAPGERVNENVMMVAKAERVATVAEVAQYLDDSERPNGLFYM